MLSAANAAGVGLTVNRVGSMLTAFFTDEPVVDYASARKASAASFASWFKRLVANGVSLPPSQFEAAFVSTAHDEEALAFLERSLSDSFKELRTAPSLG
jgi:glutamate-1-semialdehyde 2,1-aminomutase